MTGVNVTATSAPLERSRLSLRDRVALGVSGMRTRRGRSLLTGLGIAIGIAAVVAVIGVSASSRAHLLAALDELGTNYLTVTAGQSFIGEAAELPQHPAGAVERLDGVAAASAVGSVDGTVRRTDQIDEAETGGIGIRAVDFDLLDTLNGTVASGRFLDGAADAVPQVALGAVAARRLGIEATTGTPMVWLGRQWFAVVGILEALPLAPELDTAAMVSWGSAVQLADGGDVPPNAVYVRTASAGDVDAVRPLVPPTVFPVAPESVDVTRPSDALEARATAESAFTALLLGLSAVALLVGGIGIANVLIIAVLERRGEVGIRRALGATRGHIRSQFLLEAVALAAAGGATGVAIGAAITVGYAWQRGWPVALPPAGLAAGFVAAVAVGAVAGVFPAMRAARLSPVEAVRPA